MNKLDETDIKMKKIDYKALGDLGIRFLLFRKAIKKTQSQLAEELGIDPSEIAAIEKGAPGLKINHLHYLNKKYGLNINWMLCKGGGMFVKDHPPDSDLDGDFVMNPPVDRNDPRYEKYIEFFQLLQVPAIEKAIMESLKEIKDHLREEE